MQSTIATETSAGAGAGAQGHTPLQQQEQSLLLPEFGGNGIQQPVEMVVILYEMCGKRMLTKEELDVFLVKHQLGELVTSKVLDSCKPRIQPFLGFVILRLEQRSIVVSRDAVEWARPAIWSRRSPEVIHWTAAVRLMTEGDEMVRSDYWDRDIPDGVPGADFLRSILKGHTGSFRSPWDIAW